jgi:hypothetical protein
MGATFLSIADPEVILFDIVKACQVFFQNSFITRTSEKGDTSRFHSSFSLLYHKFIHFHPSLREDSISTQLPNDRQPLEGRPVPGIGIVPNGHTFGAAGSAQADRQKLQLQIFWDVVLRVEMGGFFQ